jgi:predicted lipoprotein with Yx(FWY)xxD motif
MTRRSPIKFLAGAAAVPVVALAVAGCGGSSSGATASAPPAHPKTASGSPATIGVASTGLGKILVDSQGRTLYLFKKDSATTSSCIGACATAWPPLRTSGKPVAGSGVNASLLGTIARSDGQPQVAYKGHPLYLFVKDQKAGDTKGEGLTAFGGSWFAVSVAGNQVSPRASSSGRGSSNSAGRSSSSASGNGATSPAPAAPAQPAPKPAPRPAAPSPPKASPPSSSNGIPQNGGGDGDADNNGGPSDGDGGI